MASINKLSIRGVRAFSPDDAEQVLEFYFPCTIIVGANGCGKTTIIESLKFAVCGALPPGVKAGQAFVHDPRSIGQSIVKANIKLRFTNRAGTSMVVVRSMEVQQKKTTMSFKQLDGVLRTVDKEGNRQSLSHKCTELDKQIPILLGVSKPILEHVVFCHQEDASWPLQEGAVLKKRFDDIFDSTRYTKALKVYADLKKEYTSKVKDIKADVAGFASHRHAARSFKQELEKLNDSMEELEDQILEDRKALKENQEEQERIQAIIEQVDEMRNDSESRKNELTLQQQVVKKQKSMLHDDLTQQHSVRELKDMLRDFDQQMGSQLEKKSELEGDIAALQKDLQKLRKQETDLQSRLGRLQAEKEAHEKRLKSRYEKMVDIGQTYGLGDALTQVSQTQASQTQNTSYHASSMLDISMSATSRLEQPPVLNISQEDMDEFYRALTKKEEELKDTVNQHRDNYQQQADQLQAYLTDITAKQKSIETDRKKLTVEQGDARKELQQISVQLSSTTTRLKKRDVEEAQQKAEKFAKERDELNANPRRTEISTEIRSLDEKTDRLKREIDDDQVALKDLRNSAEAQNAIVVLKEQSTKDLETLSETIKEHAFDLQQFNISTPAKLPGSDGGDENGEELTMALEKVVDDVSDKFGSLNLELAKVTDDANKYQQCVSEKTALLSHDQHTVASKRARMSQLDGDDGSIDQVRRVVARLRQSEHDMGITTPLVINETKPQELFAYLGNRLDEEESQSTEGIQPETIRKIISRLKKQVRRAGQQSFVCPCCTRELEDETEIEKFDNQMKLLISKDSSPLLKLDERNKTARSNYQEWRQVVADKMNDVLDYRRIANEVNDLEHSIAELEGTLSEQTRKLADAKDSSSEIQSQVDSLRLVLEAAKRWAEAAGRVAEKRMQVNQKQLDLSVSDFFGGRDLQTVEQEVAGRMEKKEEHSNQVGRLNKEMANLNNRIIAISTQASRLDQIARTREAQLAKEQQQYERKKVLADKIEKCTAEDKVLGTEVAPLKQKIRSKENEKARMRALNKEEEERLSSTFNSFTNAAKDLREVTLHIDEYTDSSNDKELDNMTAKSEELVQKSKEKQQQIETIQPELDSFIKAVEDQERHKKNLKENIELIGSNHNIQELKKEISRLEEAASSVEGYDTCYDDMDSLATRKQDILSKSARLDGRKGEILESVRGLKRKLSTEEYREVDEQYRISMIKQETTEMAVRDLDKYHKALDKALLRFHSIKIAEINTIIRDLWNLTYKGEDIANIEIVSGQESGSRANRSYNYRVMMTKGNTQLDMRGRCSAGQRVLASIVIRLALAETFCINCGCIALDEPTVNLDYKNKRGLAIALAQIIATRSQQSNFQLILITHDEDFVSFMKTELSSQTGFQMPEKYFQVRREEGTDGKFYSKIDAIDWDELV